MSRMPALNPNKHYEGWETVEDDFQELEPATNLQQQQNEKDPSEQEKLKQAVEDVEEHQHYEVVIESPGVKEVAQKVVYDAADDTDGEATINYNNEPRRQGHGQL